MRRPSVALLALALVGCSGPSEIGKPQTDAAFPPKGQEAVEAELRKDPKAWADYQESKRKDAAYGQKGR